ncbi:MAG TPA: hypothetical protein VHC90_22220 [Bryobacteraceae bacterium]|nr:hypothetical protein [Bryobacteraceae bacterium]
MNMNRAGLAISLLMALSIGAQAADPTPPPPILGMPGSSKPLGAITTPKTFIAAKLMSAAVIPSVQMKILVLAGDSSEYSYQSITTFLTQIGVPYTGIAVDTLTPDSNGNRLTNLSLVDSVTGNGLYQGIIETNSNFTVCNPTCTALLSTTDWNTLDNYASNFQVRVVSYYTWPEAKWGLAGTDSGSAHTASNPLQVSLTAAGAAIFSYINAANAIPVAGSGTGSIWVYQANPVAAAGETTTAIMKAGSATVGVTHTTSDGRESMSLTFDNYPTLLHSLAFSYGVVNWVTKGVFLGARQVYLNPQDDDILFGDRLYAPTLPQCPNDPSCPDVEMSSADLQALNNWQNSHRIDPQFSSLATTFAYVGIGATFGPAYAQEAQTMTEEATDYGWLSHGYVHGDPDCFTTLPGGTCVPATLQDSVTELQRNIAFGASLALPVDYNGYVTPFNNGLGNQAYLQAASWLGVTSVISANNPPSVNTGSYSTLVPPLYLVPRRVTNLLWNESSPKTGVYGSLPDEYNSFYGPNGSTPFFTQNQTYSQIIDNESTDLLLLRLLPYEPFPLGFHTSNSVTYDGVHSIMTDLLDATIQKYEKLYTLPVHTLRAMRDIAPVLQTRQSYNASGVTGVYTPGVAVVLKTVNAATIPVTGACSQSVCPLYGGQMQDTVLMQANSSVTLSLSAGSGVGVAAVTVNPSTISTLSLSQGLVTLNGVASSPVTVSLSSNNTAAVVPSSVTIAAGDQGAAFTVTTGAVSGPTNATITATLNGVTNSTTLTINPAITLLSVALSPSTVSGGTPSQGTVTLTAAAPQGGIVVELVSDNNAAVVPASVTIPAGSLSATFNVSTSAVSGTTTGNIVAVYNYAIQSALMTVTTGSAVTLSNVSVNPPQVTGGTSSVGTVTLSGIAPSGGIQVALSTDGASTVPANVTIPANSASTNFTVGTNSVTSTITSTITGSYNGVVKTTTLVITPAVSLTSVSLNPTSVIGGSGSTGTVTLSGPAPAGGIQVSLSATGSATVPASVTVAANSLTATFAVTTTSVASTSNAVITASYNGVLQMATLVINPGVSLSAVSLNPTSVTGGTGSTGTVTLSGPAPTGGITVALSDNSSSVTLPASVNVAANQTTATFAVTTLAVTTTTTATISATYNGVVKTATLTLTPALAISGVSLNPASVVGGSGSTGTVTLNGPAPTGGITVTLSDNSSSVTTPASVNVAANQTSATFSITTLAVTATTTATITATYSGSSKTATLTVTPALALSGVSLNPTSVVGGSGSTGTVTLNGPAPTGGITVTLSDNSSSVTTPASVTVAANQTTATFAVTTLAVTTTTTATISATYSGSTKTATLTVTPNFTLSNFTLSATNTAGGTSVTGTVTLTAAAPTGGVPVALASNSSFASVPASVTVAAGSKTATFTVTTTGLTTGTTVDLTASYGSTTLTAYLFVWPAVYSDLTISPATVPGGTQATGTVTLLGSAPTGGFVISLSSNNSLATVPASVTVPAGSSSATFPIATRAATYTAKPSIVGTNQGTSISDTVTIIGLTSVSVSPTSVQGGKTSTGTVKLSTTAPTGGAVVALSSSNANAVVPASVTIPSGSSSATFQITTTTVTASGSATIGATMGGLTENATLTITP